MAIKARIPSGQNHYRTSAMWQWDYGQTLEIEADNLPSIIEVHFACRDMTEAVVHTCSVVNGMATVPIPDRCLEQASEITAWVYEIDGTAGRTIYSVTIPITARTRPAHRESIPQSVQDTYTQLITEVNELIETLQSGTMSVGHANTATSANTAGSAVNDGNGNKISDTYMEKLKGYTAIAYGTILPVGMYHFCVTESMGTGSGGFSFFVDLGVNGNPPSKVYSPLASPKDGGSFLRVAFTYMGASGYVLSAVENGWIAYNTDTTLYTLDFGEVSDSDFFTIYYKKID